MAARGRPSAILRNLWICLRAYCAGDRNPLCHTHRARHAACHLGLTRDRSAYIDDVQAVLSIFHWFGGLAQLYLDRAARPALGHRYPPNVISTRTRFLDLCLGFRTVPTRTGRGVKHASDIVETAGHIRLHSICVNCFFQQPLLLS